MQAGIDSYTQVSIRLSRKEAERLAKYGKLNGKILRTSREDPWKYYPLKLGVSKKGWYGAGIPRNSPNKKYYRIDMPPDGPKLMLEGKILGTSFTSGMRKIYISLDSVL